MFYVLAAIFSALAIAIYAADDPDGGADPGRPLDREVEAVAVALCIWNVLVTIGVAVAMADE